MIVSCYNIWPQMSTLLIFRHTYFILFLLKELYIYKFIVYSLLYIEETEVLSCYNRGFFWG